MIAGSGQFPPILIVDDEEDQRLLTCRMLRLSELPNPVVPLAGGREAIDFLSICWHGRGVIPALAFLDLDMPSINGIEVLRWIRGIPELKSVKIVIFTSSENPENERQCASLGADGYLLKNTGLTVFRSFVHMTLQNASASCDLPRIATALGSRVT